MNLTCCPARTLTWLTLLFVASSAQAAPLEADVKRQAQALLANAVDVNGPGMAILVSHGDQILFRGARGRANVELDASLSPGDVFRIGSNTKPFTAAAIYKLAEHGRIALDDRLSRYLPTFPNAKHISVAQLLCHTSGVKNYTEIDGYFDAAIRADVSTGQLVDVIKDLPLDFEPGTDWKYSNSGYVLLGAVIEKVAGKPWHAATKEMFTTPLGLDHTTYDDGSTLIGRRASGYSVDAEGRIVNAPYMSMSQAAAAGALVSNTDDLFHWMRALHSGKVLSADSYRRMTTPAALSAARTAGSACGLEMLSVRGEPAFEHVGRDPGFMSETLMLPKPAIGVVVLTNTDTPRTDITVIAAKLAAIALGQPYPERKPVVLTPTQMQALAGDYRRGQNGRRTIAVRDGRLYTHRDGGRDHELQAASPDELYFDEVLDYFMVTRDGSGAVIALEEFVNGEHQSLHSEKMIAAQKRTDDSAPSH
ncbi:MAG: serine hydrolase domain-containing protein [Dokdonella sp.]